MIQETANHQQYDKYSASTETTTAKVAKTTSGATDTTQAQKPPQQAFANHRRYVKYSASTETTTAKVEKPTSDATKKANKNRHNKSEKTTSSGVNAAQKTDRTRTTTAKFKTTIMSAVQAQKLDAQKRKKQTKTATTKVKKPQAVE